MPAQVGSRRARLEPRACAGGPGLGGGRHLTSQDVSATKSVFWKGEPGNIQERKSRVRAESTEATGVAAGDTQWCRAKEEGPARRGSSGAETTLADTGELSRQLPRQFCSKAQHQLHAAHQLRSVGYPGHS